LSGCLWVVVCGKRAYCFGIEIESPKARIEMTRNSRRRAAASFPAKREDCHPAGSAKPARVAPPLHNEPARREGARERRDPEVVRIYGFHSVAAALKAPRRELIRLYATAAAAERLKPEIGARGVETRIMSVEEIAARTPREAVHQGVLLEARPLAPIDISELPANGLVLVLDQITDPHNVGAILRTAAAFAVDALVTTERHSPELSGALAKSASGGLEHVPISTVTNLARALAEMGDIGYLRVGLDSEAAAALTDVAFARPLALVLGAEGRGLRRLTRERCDALARLDLPGAIKSLNVSNACAIALALVHERLGIG
jgi:23S rRNA (guanosine2251-2'-O)-methyltransferase